MTFDNHHRTDWDTGSVAAIITGVVAAATAVVSGFWQWMSGRRKVEADSQSLAQSAALAGLSSLIAYSQAHIERLEKRTLELKEEIHSCEHHVLILERLLSKHNIDLPKEDRWS